MTRRNYTSTVAILRRAAVMGGAVLCLAGTARADGVIMSPLALDAKVRAELEAGIATARASDKAAFDALAAIDTYKPEGIRRSRHNQPSAARALMRLGERGFWPIVEWTAFRAERGNLTDDQWHVLGAGLLQALGVLEDSRAAPVLRAAFAGARDAMWLDRAAEGLGMLCGSPGAGSQDEQLLIAGSRASNPKSDQRAAAIAGLGHCRTARSARTLAAIFRSQSADSPLAERTARALGYVGSSWALKADARIGAEDAENIRRTAAEALVDVLPHQATKAARSATARGILMVEHPVAAERLAVAELATTGDVLIELQDLHRLLDRKLARSAK